MTSVTERYTDQHARIGDDLSQDLLVQGGGILRRLLLTRAHLIVEEGGSDAA